MKFPFMYADVVNANKRVYPKRVIDKAVAAVAERVKIGGSIFGSSGHPEKDLQLDDVSHLIESVWVEGNAAWTAAKILPTSKGKNLSTIIEHGGTLGVSARGLGNMRKRGDGVDEVQEDYVLLGVDFVLNPSFGIHVSKENVFESVSFTKIAEDVVREKYRRAIIAGYKGSLEDYRRRVLRART